MGNYDLVNVGRMALCRFRPATQTAKKGTKVFGLKFQIVQFKVIDENSKYFNKTFHMNIYPDRYNETQNEYCAHNIVKNNLVEGNVFDNLQVHFSIPDNTRPYINHYNKDVILVRNIKDEK